MKVRFEAKLRAVHRWIGLTLGCIFALVGVSGSLLLFQSHFFRWAHGEMIPANLPQRIGSLERWVSSARAAVPQLHGPIVIWPPQTAHNVSDAGMLVFTGTEPGGIGHLGLTGVLVAPASGEVLGVVDIDRSPAYAPIFLHGALWAGNAGRVVVGIMGLGALILLPIGVYLWWPPRPQLAAKLSPRPWRHTLAHAARLHNWAGIWLLPPLLVLAISGLSLAQPHWVAPTLALLPGPQTHANRAKQICTGPLGLDAVSARARALAPSTVLTAVIAEGEPHVREFVLSAPDSQASIDEVHVTADLDCGTVTIEATPDSRAPRDAFKAWLSSLHDGTAFGMTGRLVVTLAGLAPLVLAWSGIRIWMRRRGWLKPRRGRALR